MNLSELRKLRETIQDQLNVDLKYGALCYVSSMLQDNDEDALLYFFGNIIEGGLTRDGCIAVSNLLADYSECGRPGCVGYKPDGNHQLAF